MAVALSSLAFGVIFNIRGKHLFFATLSGIVSWAVYTFSAGIYVNDIPQYFLGAAVMALFCEIAARTNKTPVTMYLVVGLIPLVPGWLIFKTMMAYIDGDTELFTEQLLYAVGIAGAIALGVVTVSSLFRLFTARGKKETVKN